MKNWNDFTLPLHIDESNEYIEAFNTKVDYYYKEFTKLLKCKWIKPYRSKLKKSLIDMKKQKGLITYAIEKYLCGEQNISIDIVKRIIKKNKRTLIRPIKNAYAFNGNSIYADPDSEIDSLYLVRGRKVDPYKVLSAKELSHMPLDMRKNVTTYRYSIPGIPALYLACNSYVTWQEMRNVPLENLAISNFDLTNIIDEKIIDLTYYIELFFEMLNSEQELRRYNNGIKEMINVIKIIPLIIACFVVDDTGENNVFKIQYLFPQLLMQFLDDNCIGIAYRSTRIEKGNLISSNLVIPILSFNKNMKYGNIMDKIKITDSLNLGYFKDYIYGKPGFTNINAKGIGAKSRKNFFDTKFRYSFLSFHKVFYDRGSYDGMTIYQDSVFYWFDEYLLFLNEHKTILNEKI